MAGLSGIDRVGQFRANVSGGTLSSINNIPEATAYRQGLTPSAEAHYKYSQQEGYAWDSNKTDPSLRPDGSPKGNGYFGPLKMEDGSDGVMTEFSQTVDINGKLTLVPTVVPTLNKEEIDYLLKGGDPHQRNKIADSIYNKSVDHAKYRLNQGLSPFYD